MSRAETAGPCASTARPGKRWRRPACPMAPYNVSQGHGWVVTPGLGGGSLCILDAAGRLQRRKQVARSSHDACIVVAG